MPIQRSEVQLQVRGQSANAYLVAPASSPRSTRRVKGEKGGQGVLLLHAWWGMKPFFKQVCDRLADQGFSILAPDLYQGRTAQTIEEAEALMEKRDFEWMGDTVKAAKDYLAAQNKGKPIGVLGSSMGASWSLVVAANQQDVAAAVLFYGSEGVDFSQVKAKILGHYSDADEWGPLDGVRAMETDMKTAGLDVKLHVYPKVGHWFVEQDRPEYDSAAAALAWERTFKFLRKILA